MNDRERLIQWMQENGRTPSTLAVKTGDTPSSISQMVNGKRDVNDAFKWRFQRAFGHDIAMSIFPLEQDAQ